jgi:hypothetical protein
VDENSFFEIALVKSRKERNKEGNGMM